MGEHKSDAKIVCSVCGANKRPGPSKRHDQTCSVCGKHFCPGRSSDGATTCSPECKHTLQSQLSKQNWEDENFRRKCSTNVHLPLCQFCGGRIAQTSHRHNRKCVICGGSFCGKRAACSAVCTKALQSQMNQTHWENPEYREKQASHNSRSAQAGTESAEAREIRGLLGLREHEISKFGYRWDGWWPERKLFWEHQGCNWHYCKICGHDQKFTAGDKGPSAKLASDLKKREAAAANGWNVFYTWTHDLKEIRQDPIKFFELRLGFVPVAIEIVPDPLKPAPKCSHEGCKAAARPGRTTCSDSCYEAVRVAGAARLNETNAGSAGAIICPRPGCGQMVVNPRYHDIACKGCGLRFCVKNQSNLSEFHSLSCYFEWRKSQTCDLGGRRHLISNTQVHNHKCEVEGCEVRFCGYRRFCPEHTKARISAANSASTKAQWADPQKRARIMRGIRSAARR